MFIQDKDTSIVEICIGILTLWNVYTEQRCTNGKTSLCSPIHGKLFVLAGAGGAGRALAFGAKSRGARVVIFDIDYGIYLTKNLTFF